MPNGKGVLGQIEHKLGIPPLAEVVETLSKLPDSKNLKLIKDVLVIAERVSKTGPELEKVTVLIREISSMPVEKLDKLEKVLKRIEGILKKAPQELMAFLSSLKEE